MGEICTNAVSKSVKRRVEIFNNKMKLYNDLL